MSNKAITDLTEAGAGQGADLVFLYQGGALKRCTLSTLLQNLAQMFPCAAFTTAALPSPADHRGRIVYCPDGDAGNPALVVSNGAGWFLLPLGTEIVVAPGSVTLGTPDGNGIPYTMPAVPTGAGSLILQKADDDGFGNPDDGTWTDIVNDLGTGESGTDGTGSGGGSATGAQNTRFHYRAKNTTGGATGAASSAVTVGLPDAAAAPTLTPGASPGDLDITTPGLPGGAIAFASLQADLSGTGGGFGELVANPEPATLYPASPGADVYCEAYVVAANIYGTTNGATGNGTTAP